ncbi:MAG: hypothetical protein M0Z31_03695 [Clostridia bacterium]|nr:hypothetical protein [Clostridia bacterium]
MEIIVRKALEQDVENLWRFLQIGNRDISREEVRQDFGKYCILLIKNRIQAVAKTSLQEEKILITNFLVNPLLPEKNLGSILLNGIVHLFQTSQRNFSLAIGRENLGLFRGSATAAWCQEAVRL